MQRKRLLLTLGAAGFALAAGFRLASEPGHRVSGGASPGRAPRPRASGVAEGSRDVRAAGRRVAAPARASAADSAVAGPRRLRFAGGQFLFARDAAPRPGPLPEVARRVLDENRETLGIDRLDGELRLAREFTSLSGHHVRFRQFVGGVPVEGGEVSVHVARDGRPLLISVSAFPVGGVATTPAVTADEAVAAAREFLLGGDDAASDDDGETEDAAGGAAAERPAFTHRAPKLLVRPEGRSGRLVWRVDATTRDETARVSVDALDGAVVATRDLRLAVDGQAQVFNPNPVASTHNRTLGDRRDADSLVLKAARQPVVLPRLDGSGHLRGTWCDAARGPGDVSNAGFDWSPLTRSFAGFEAANAYFHVDRTQALLQELGIAEANAEQQRIDVHAIADDQSYFDIDDDIVRFGDGGVDDAEDGDIVVHEYGHAVQADQVDEYGATSEGSAMGEGFADFLACTLHSSRTGADDPVWDPLVGAWDATSYSNADPPFLRRVDLDKHYPQDLQDEAHSDGEIWSRFLWDLRGLLGADESLRVVVESHYYLDANARFLHGANAVLVANASLRDGRDDEAIRGLLRNRGIKFNFPPLDAPPEDRFEENDDMAHAAPVALGVHDELLLADDDWFQVSLPPFRRLRAQADFEPADVDVDLEIRTLDGAAVDWSRGVSGVEVVTAAAGEAGATYLVRAMRGGSSIGIAAYRLALQDVDLDLLRGGRTTLRRTTSGVADAVRFDVAAAKTGATSKLVVRSIAQRRGSVNDMRVVSPSGVTVAELGSGRTTRGTKLVIDATEAGTWRIEVQSRDGSSGRYTLQAKVRRR